MKRHFFLPAALLLMLSAGACNNSGNADQGRTAPNNPNAEAAASAASTSGTGTATSAAQGVTRDSTSADGLADEGTQGSGKKTGIDPE